MEFMEAQTKDMVALLEKKVSEHRSQELVVVKSRLEVLKETVESEKTKREENAKSIKLLQERLSEVDGTVREVVTETIKEKTEERMKLTTEKVIESIKTMKEALIVQISESTTKDITTLIKEKNTLIQTSLEEHIKETTHVIDVGMKKESDAAASNLEERFCFSTGSFKRWRVTRLLMK